MTGSGGVTSLECTMWWAEAYPLAVGDRRAVGVECPFVLGTDKMKSEQLLKLPDTTQFGKLLHVVLQNERNLGDLRAKWTAGIPNPSPWFCR